MMGTQARLSTPISLCSLESLVPADHFYRQLERILDLTFVRELVQECYTTDKGRPSIDPVVFFKLQLVMFFEGIRSERQLLRLAADRLSVRWYLGYNLSDPLPDHSSLTRIRTRYGVQVFRHFFEMILQQCQQAGLVWGHELYFDATQVQADAALDSLTARFAAEAREARKTRDARPERRQQTVEALEALEAGEGHLATLFPKDEADARESTTPTLLPTPLPQTLPDAQRTELAAANTSRHDWIAQAGRQQREVQGQYQRTADFRISTTDPDATPMRLKGGGTHLGYQTHYVVDGGKRRIIVGVLVAPGEVMENQPMLDLLWRVRFRWKLRPRQVTGDTKYGTLQNIKAIEDAGIRAYIPLFNREHEHGAYFGSSRFTYDAVHDRFLCPAGQPLVLFRREYQAEKMEYRADAAICNACVLKAQCTPSPSGRQVHRSFHAAYLERVQGYYPTAAYQKALRKRKVWVEPLFAEAKDWHGLRRFRLRGLWRVNCEALLIAAGQNLKRLLARQVWGRRPLPSGAALAVAQVNAFVVGFVCVAEIILVEGHHSSRKHCQTPTRHAYMATEQ